MAQAEWRIHACHWGVFEALTDGERIFEIRPFAKDPAPSPIIHAVPDWLDANVRISQPMARKSWLETREKSDGTLRGREDFVPISWDDALSLAAEEVTRVKETYGAASRFGGSYGWTSAGRIHHAPSLLKRVLNFDGGCTRHKDTYSIAAGAVMLDHALGDHKAYMGGAPTFDELAKHTKVLMVFGAMSPRTAQNEAGGMAEHHLEANLEALDKAGIRIIHVSPYRDDLPAQIHRDWWAIRPGTDTALMLGLAGEILGQNLANHAFLERYTSGSEIFLANLRGQSDGIVKDANWAASITGLDADAIRNLARALVAERSFIAVSWALQRADHGEQPFWAALGLAALIGQMGEPGGGMGCGYGSLGNVGRVFHEEAGPSMPATPNAVEDFIPVSLIAEALENPGARFSYRGREQAFPDLKLIWWAGGNPYHHHQDLNRLQHAWSRPETIIVQDPFWTATAKRADLVLPATTSIERDDISGNRRSEYLVAMKQLVAPLGQSRDDFAIFDELAERLGVRREFTGNHDAAGWIRLGYERASVNNAHIPSFEEFWQTGYLKLDHATPAPYLADFRKDPDAAPLSTETGKIVIGSALLNEAKYADCAASPSWFEPAEWLGSDDQGNVKIEGHRVFHLLSSQPKDKLHSQLDFSPKMRAQRAKDGRAFLKMNAQDAGALGLQNGALVRVFNARGACLARLEIDEGLRSSVVILPTGAWLHQPNGVDDLDQAGNPNVLTLDKGSSQFGQGCAAHTCLVAVEEWRGPALDFVVAEKPKITERSHP